MALPARQPTDLAAVFAAFRPILEPYIPRMTVIQDNERGLYLNTRSMMKNRQPLFFASIAINKNYVSFHLFPVSMYPDLLDGIGDLANRMQGKSCFNFRKVDPNQVEGMRALVAAGHRRLETEGDITSGGGQPRQSETSGPSGP
ncbi:MAG: hypothetical protein H0T72_04175 [Chloroflexia bacterium]|jgi:hypothetical protein|nr:hypothetical protein [Chloroflexia bacterium]